MHTVIIAEDYLIDDIKNNPTFFGPFLSRGDVTFCAWDPLEDKVENAVPDLDKIVCEFRDWRALIVCNEASLKKKNTSDSVHSADTEDKNGKSVQEKLNPFDVVGYVDQEREKGLSGEELDAFIQSRHQARLEAFKTASDQPLTQLVTLLCEEPETEDGMIWDGVIAESEKERTDRESAPAEGKTPAAESDTAPVSDGDTDEKNGSEQALESRAGKEELHESNTKTEKDGRDFEIPDDEVRPDARAEIAEYENYRDESRKKHELRQEILEGTPSHFNRPSEVLCIAKRDYRDNAEVLYSTWSSHLEIQYSDFYNYNLYFDKMRYLLLDVSTRDCETQYMSDFKFLYTLLLIACNPLPDNCLHPNRVYLAESVYDQPAFEKTLKEYYDRLTATIYHVEDEIKTLSNTSKKPISDRDAENLLHSNVSIPVSLTTDFNKDTLYADYKGLGLSGDCPTDEMAKWNEQKKSTTNALMRYLKQPRRALKKAARDARSMCQFNEDAASRIDEFQVDDLEAVMENHEIEMVSAGIPNVFDEKHYRETLDQAGDEVRKKTSTRMSRNCTIGLGICVLALFLIGLLPMWLGSLSEPAVIPGALIMMVVALVLLAATGFVCLFFLRHGTVQKWKDYNLAMHEVVDEVDQAVGLSSKYLSLVCRFMQEHAALEWAKGRELPNKSKCQLLNMHLARIYEQREMIINVFGDMVDTSEPEDGTPIYDYDFLRSRTYDYPLPVEADHKDSVIFMESDVSVEVPYKLIDSLTVRREEIYD